MDLNSRSIINSIRTVENSSGHSLNRCVAWNLVFHKGKIRWSLSGVCSPLYLPNNNKKEKRMWSCWLDCLSPKIASALYLGWSTAFTNHSIYLASSTLNSIIFGNVEIFKKIRINCFLRGKLKNLIRNIWNIYIICQNGILKINWLFAKHMAKVLWCVEWVWTCKFGLFKSTKPS